MSAAPISFAVLVSYPVADYFGDRPVRAYIDGKRVSLAEAREVASGPYVTVSCLSTERSRNGKRWHQRKLITI